MIKNLGYYVIPEIFKYDLRNWQSMNTNGIIEDFYELADILKLDINLDSGSEWQEDEELWDLMLFSINDFRGYIGNFYITWMEDKNWACSNIWFTGSKADNDSDQVHWSWDNK